MQNQTLTSRETEIAELLTEGLSNKEIGDRLAISYHTVKSVLEHIYEKYETHNRVQLAVKTLKIKYGIKD